MPLTEKTDTNVAKGSVEQTYQKLTQHQHILQRPDTYVGSIEAVTAEAWVFDAEAGRMRQRKVSYVPGLYKIFDEILVNAADNKQRDASMSEIRVEIDQAAGRVSIMNNGKGIPVVVHKEHQIYVPELIFGHLLTSSNYNDEQKKVTGGRNGYGAKLANIFSREFVVETSDSSEGKKFKQVFRDNMTKVGTPEIKPSKQDWTKITWAPDLAKFGMEAMDDDIVALMERRAYDMAGCTHASVKVFLNGKQLPVRDFKSYIDLFLGPKQAPDAIPRVFEKVGDRWEVAVAASDDGFTQVSFVNSIHTSKGGTHVSHVADQVVDKVLEHLKKKHKGLEKVLKPNHVKSHLRLFINCLVENPAFDSQTKENMTLKASAFGSKCVPSDKFFKEALSCGVLESILSFAQSKQSKDLKKTDGSKKARLTGIPKLDDANEAGGRNGHKCTLIITEGDSAKALAVAGLSVIGRDHYGVFPLRGKLLNVRDAAHATIMNNKEISELKQILGLQQGKTYDDEASLKSMRYGKLMIMTDQDHDGSHIKGLVINFIHCYWPALLQKHDFLREFVTPLVKATKGRHAVAFFTLNEYLAWRNAQGAAAAGYTIKYYKGLGTSSAAEAKAYFSDLDLHELSFKWTGEADRDGIIRAFSKSMVEARKEWLRKYDPAIYVDHSASTLTYSDFVDKELIHFSNADNLRSIPSCVDGLKPGQRKILFACFKRGKGMLKNEVKVAQLAGYVAEHSAYHHGEASLGGTIVGMAQTFVGSNNIALLFGAGQFGTRLMGGKDAASPRYIFARLPQLTRLIFHPDDDALLEYLEDDGQRIEPRFYVPVLPMVLVNGAEGIGTGWSTSVPNFNPREIVANLRRLMAGEETLPMAPWYRGFSGVVAPADAKGSYITYGTVAPSGSDDRAVRISELPVRKWTQDYKESVLEPLLQAGDKDGTADAMALSEVRENHTDTTVAFTLRFSTGEAAAAARASGLHKALKLSSSVSTSNMTLFDPHGRIKKYEAVDALLRDFYALRLSYYEKRKLHLQEKLGAEWSKLDNRMRFVLAVLSGELKIANRKKAELVAELHSKGYAPFEPVARRPAAGDAAQDDGDEPAADQPGTGARGYDYLLSMPLWSLTRERVEALRAECEAKEAELAALVATSPVQLWERDLAAVEEGLTDWEAELDRAAADDKTAQAKGKARAGKLGPKKAEPMEVDSDSDYADGEPKRKKPPPKRKAPAAPAPPAGTDFAEAVPPPPPPAAQRERKERPPAKGAAGSSSDPPSAEAAEGEELSLMERLARKAAVSTHGNNWSAMMEDDGPKAAKPRPAKAAAAKPAAPKRAKASPIVLSDDDASGADELGAPPPPPRAAPRRAAAAAKKYTGGSEEEDGWSDSGASSPSASPLPKPKPKRACKEPAPAEAPRQVVSLASDDDDDAYAPPAKPPPAAKKAQAAKPPAAKPPAAKPPAAKPPAAKRPPAKKRAVESSDEDEAPSAAPPAASRMPRRAAAAAAIKKYTAASDHEEDTDVDSEESYADE